ncbi:MAG: TIGR04053 family radical SAM/SPASM domain-containing protein [Thaumarchaeota archaeon]|nr:TIGR04053 family radical SAM/SPASM domain-containing protein [Nitrososphaerota archaeon]
MVGTHHRSLDERPILVFWETTKACLLSCFHCRASALSHPLPGELSTQEGKALLRQIAEFGSPLPTVIFTGGDLIMRSDIFDLLQYASTLGLPIAVSPSVTPLLTVDTLRRFNDLKVKAVSISLDGAFASTHDRIRQVSGTFDATIQVIKEAVKLGLHLQVNTTVMRRNMEQLADIFHMVRNLGVRSWEVFFLIKTGRALENEDLRSVEYEDVCQFLYDASRYSVTVRAIEAPFIRRIGLQRTRNASSWRGSLYEDLTARLVELEGPPTAPSTFRPYGTLDGDGVIFVAFDGTIFPGGFVPYALGNIRESPLADVYRKHNLLIKIRRREFNGRCGFCDFRFCCGGSRARAYAYSVDPLGSDPACIYVPPADRSR